MSYQALSIKDIVNYIECGRMFLSKNQKNSTWKEDQIENLFNSLFLGYPIGVLIFWKTSKRIINNDNTLDLYEFIRNYHERDNCVNTKTSLPITTDYESYYIVLDGQQYVSSLYIAIKGSLTNNVCLKKELYFNLFNKNKRFKFLTEEEAKNNKNKWFKVKDMFKFEDEFDIAKFAIEEYKNDKVGKNLCTLFKLLTNKEDSLLCSYGMDEYP